MDISHKLGNANGDMLLRGQARRSVRVAVYHVLAVYRGDGTMGLEAGRAIGTPLRDMQTHRHTDAHAARLQLRAQSQ